MPFNDSKNLQIVACLLLNKSRYRCRLFIFSTVTCFSDKREIKCCSPRQLKINRTSCSPILTTGNTELQLDSCLSKVWTGIAWYTNLFGILCHLYITQTRRQKNVALHAQCSCLFKISSCKAMLFYCFLQQNWNLNKLKETVSSLHKFLFFSERERERNYENRITRSMT